MQESSPNIDNAMAMLSSMPAGQLILAALFMATWLVGGNILIALHYKRMGKHWASGFRPFAFPFKDFNKYEWLALLFLAVMALSFANMAATYSG